MDELLKRLELLEAKVEQVAQPSNEQTEVFLTKAEVHQRFELFYAAHAKELARMQDQLEELRAQMRSLQELLLQKADANEVLTAAQIHQRFRLFAEAMPASKAAAEAPQTVSLATARCETPCEDVMSRAEVHERFRLFQASLAAQPVQVSDAQNCACTNCTSPTVEAEVQEVPLRPESSWIGWLFSTGIMSAGVMLGLMSLCVALGESKALEDRLNLLQERVEDAKGFRAESSALVAEAPHLAMRGKLLSGAAGAAVGSTTGAISGSLAGGAFGAVAGLVPAVFTFGLSVPLGACVGSTLGLLGGSVLGGGTGAIGGVQAASWYKARKDRS